MIRLFRLKILSLNNKKLSDWLYKTLDYQLILCTLRINNKYFVFCIFEPLSLTVYDHGKNNYLDPG